MKNQNANHPPLLLYNDWLFALLELPDVLRHKILDALVRYGANKEEPSDIEVKYSMFHLMKHKIDIDRESYEEKCRKRSEINRENGKKGGAPLGNQNARIQPKITETTENNNNSNSNSNFKNNILGVSTPNDFSNLIDWIDNNEELDFMANRNNFKTYLTAKNLSKLQQSYSIEEIKKGILDLNNLKNWHEKGFKTFYQMLKTYLDGNSQYW